MKNAIYTIDQVCEKTGLSRRTVHYYVQKGLLERPEGRGRGGLYAQEHVDRLAEIRTLQEHGWTLAAIATHNAKIGEARPEHPLRGCAKVDLFAADGEAAGPVERRACAHYDVAEGVQLVVDRRIEDIHDRKIREIVRTAQSIMEREG